MYFISCAYISKSLVQPIKRNAFMHMMGRYLNMGFWMVRDIKLHIINFINSSPRAFGYVKIRELFPFLLVTILNFSEMSSCFIILRWFAFNFLVIKPNDCPWLVFIFGPNLKVEKMFGPRTKGSGWPLAVHKMNNYYKVQLLCYLHTKDK